VPRDLPLCHLPQGFPAGAVSGVPTAVGLLKKQNAQPPRSRLRRALSP
jgi:hypothetical protein